MLMNSSILLLLFLLLGGQRVSAERADAVTPEPLEDAVLMEDVGARARHLPQLVLRAEILQAHGTLGACRLARAELSKTEDGPARGRDARALAAAVAVFLVLPLLTGGSVGAEEETVEFRNRRHPRVEEIILTIGKAVGYGYPSQVLHAIDAHPTEVGTAGSSRWCSCSCRGIHRGCSEELERIGSTS